jgi:hypothetical protein
MLVAAGLAARACGYEFGTLLRYAGYVGFYVLLPGAVVMHLVNRGPLSLVALLALAVPTGFAVEIFAYLACAALDAKPAYAWSPLLWLAAAAWLRWRYRSPLVRVRLAANHAGVALALAGAFLATVIMAISQMFAEAPLAQGLPTRAIFHDWVYLVSRAAVIKNAWPLDDPSLSGTPLQYHYFMMVHAAAVSRTTDVEISTVMLRLLYLPLGAVLVAQVFMLGRIVSRSPWGGVIAALLVVMASEMSFAGSYGEPMFLGLFARWLFVSPTFFFGLIYCGALLLAVARCVKRRECGARDYIWLLLLGTAGTGAKGTVLPVLICALGLWIVWRIWRERRLPLRLVAFAFVLTTAFAIVYLPTMSAWRTGDAALQPFHVFQLTQFWKDWLAPLQAALGSWLPAPLAQGLAASLCAVVVFAGTCGIRLLALPYLFWGDLEKRDRLLVSWLGAFLLASAGLGMLLELNSYGELYVILMMRLPMAVLTAAFVVSATRRIAVWWRDTRPAQATARSVPAAPFTLQSKAARVISSRAWQHTWPRAAVLAAIVVFTGATLVQTSLWWKRNRTGLREWIKTPADLAPDGYMRDLREALLWVRHNTETDAVLVPNAFTPENMKKDHWGALDRTLMGVHFYYSALSERRMWFEGPNYILDTTRARIRANLASNFFYRRQPLAPEVVSKGASYALVDRSLADGASVSATLADRVFANMRMEVYRLRGDVVAAGAGPVPQVPPAAVARR